MKLHWLHNYQGISHAPEPSRKTKLLYRAKFLQQSWAVEQIAHELYNYITKNIDFDLIVPAYCRTSITCLPEQLALQLAIMTDKDCITDYFTQPWKYNFSRKRVLLIDDVYTSGQTARTMETYLQTYSRPLGIDLLVYLKSEPIPFQIS